MLNNIDIKKDVKKILIDRDITQNKIAEKLGMSRQNLNRQLNKDISQWKIEDVEKVLDVLDYDLKIEFVKRKK